MAQGVPGSLRPRIVLTFRHYKGGRSSAKRTGRLYPGRNPWYSLSESESTSGHMVLSGVPRKKSPVTPPGIDLGTVRLVAQRLNHYATPRPVLKLVHFGKQNINTLKTLKSGVGDEEERKSQSREILSIDIDIDIDIVIDIDIFVNCNWVNTRWQWYSTHNQYIGQHK